MLTQAEYDRLLSLPKWFESDRVLSINLGEKRVIELGCEDAREKFLLDLHRGRRRLSKMTYNNRVRTTIELVRLDLDGRPHTNPDGRRIGRTHLHVFREGYGLRWAYPLEELEVSPIRDPLDIEGSFYDFCRYCNIDRAPAFQASAL